MLQIAFGADSAQKGIVDSGFQTLTLPKTGATINISFNFVYGATPYFGFGLTSIEMPSDQVYKILHTSTVTTSKATIVWFVIETVGKIKIRWLCSSGEPVVSVTITSSNLKDGSVQSQDLGTDSDLSAVNRSGSWLHHLWVPLRHEKSNASHPIAGRASHVGEGASHDWHLTD